MSELKYVISDSGVTAPNIDVFDTLVKVKHERFNYVSTLDQHLSTSSNISFNKLILADKGSNVTQTGSITSSVTSNTSIGQITTVSATIILSSSSTFTVNCSGCTSSSIVVLSPVSYSGTAGNPSYFVSATNNGSFDITIRNFNSLVSLIGNHTVKYIIF
jgi:hypothetical protein